jgi:hypothetical protein
VVPHSYTAPGHGHGILEWPRFYEMEVNGEKLVDWMNRLVAGDPADDVHCEKCRASSGQGPERPGIAPWGGDRGRVQPTDGGLLAGGSTWDQSRGRCALTWGCSLRALRSLSPHARRITLTLTLRSNNRQARALLS